MKHDRFLKFFRLVKVDEAQRLVYGLVTAEQEDRDGETCHYESTKPQYQKVNDQISKMSDGENIMPLRYMHQLDAIGAGKTISFDDAAKSIRMGFKVVDDAAWKKVLEKVLLGFSQGGKYLKRWTEGGTTYYTAEPGEVSLVDNPCLPQAKIEYAKADGSVETYEPPRLSDEELARIVKRVREDLEKGVHYLVPPDHLPYTDASGKPDHRLMGAAWAALHGGYRGNKYSGPGKQQAIERLKHIYQSEGMDTPSEKVLMLVNEISEKVGDPELLLDVMARLKGVELETHLEKLCRILSRFKEDTSTGADTMKPEEIKKAAAALGITEEEFMKRMLAFLESDDLLAKGKKGFAAAMHHLGKAMAHHEKMAKHHGEMMDMHKSHADMHKAHAEHLDNLHKAMSAMADHEEADKVLKAAAAELAAPPKKEEAASTFTKAEAETMVADAIKKAIEALPEQKKAGIFVVERGGEVKKSNPNQRDPLPV